MKPPFSRSPKRIATRRRDQGVAILWSLGSLLLLSVLVVATLSISERDRSTSRLYAQSSETKLLSQTAANLVVGQIRDATTNLGISKTWASQPGAIRVFTNDPQPDSNRAEMEAMYKLYSDETMVITGNAFDPLSDVPDPTWDDSPDIWTDINEGVSITDSDDSSQQTYVYPIANFHPDPTREIEGFDADRSSMPDGARDSIGIPMPVKWLYLLQDGQITAPSNVSGSSATFSTVVPTEDNPIVGRVAFWTDDESCKININTASESAFWDTPFSNGNTERAYVFKGPVRNEFQRYPGHPATTSLSAVLDPWLTIRDPNRPQVSELQPYWLLSPRIADGGSRGGTREVFGTSPVNTDSDRIYASVDEFSFANLSRSSRNLDDINSAGSETYFDNDFFKIAPFLLTAQSRAPEVNLFNKPRVSLWPLQLDDNQRNAVDELLAFCSTANELPYYIQRADVWTSSGSRGSSQSPTQDLNIPRNEQLYEYIYRLMDTDIPGFGGNFEEKYGDKDARQIALQMVDYIRSSVNTIPFGLSPEYRFAPSFNSEGARSVVPLADNSENIRGYGRSVTPTEAMLVFFPSKTDGLAVIQGNKDRFPRRRDFRALATEMRAFLLLETATVTPGFPGLNPHLQYRISGLNGFSVENRSLRFPAEAQIDAHSRVGSYAGSQMGTFVGGLVTLRHGSNAQFPRTVGTLSRTQYPFTSAIGVDGVPITISQDPDTANLRFSGGTIEIEVLDWTGTEILQTLTLDFPDTSIPAPYVQTDGEIDETKGEMGYNAAEDRVYLKYDSRELNFNDRLAEMNTPDNIKEWLVRPGDVTRSVEVSTAGDSPTKGDLRHVMAQASVPQSYFAPHPSYEGGTSVRFASGYRHAAWQWNGNLYVEGSAPNENDALDSGQKNTPAGQRSTRSLNRFKQSTRATAGILVPQATYFRDSVPAVPTADPNLPGGVVSLKKNGRPGDWDTGMAILEDGPFINKPDETNITAEGGRDSRNFGVGTLFNIQRNGDREDNGGVSFSPNRQIASAIQMGSLPSGIHGKGGNNRPWETLLFCPNPPSRETSPADTPNQNDHFGFIAPYDHLLADLFWMPVVEPYAISEPLSTAGKINLNHQILPFTYLTRDTGLRAVLKNMRIMAMPTDAANRSRMDPIYKEGSICRFSFRYGVNVDETLEGINRRFEEGDIYRSATEICETFLVPERISGETYYRPPRDPNYDQTLDWWERHLLTGDNVRERPYNQIYPRLTTKSNVYRIHVRVESLKKSRSSTPGEFSHLRDIVTGKWQGSFLVERFVDPNDVTLPDFASNSQSSFDDDSVDDYYQFRTLEVNEFQP
ncbi:MAG: Verru_Chthon cassette protein A [Verrucomicrobiota bacterium]